MVSSVEGKVHLVTGTNPVPALACPDTPELAGARSLRRSLDSRQALPYPFSGGMRQRSLIALSPVIRQMGDRVASMRHGSRFGKAGPGGFVENAQVLYSIRRRSPTRRFGGLSIKRGCNARTISMILFGFDRNRGGQNKNKPEKDW
jgi:hypothetical protein